MSPSGGAEAPPEAPAPIWSRRIADEFWSGAVTPLTFSLLAPPMVDRMVRRPLLTAGLDRLAEVPVFRLHAGHVYVNAALLAEVINMLPGAVRSAGLLAILPPAARPRVRDAGTFEGLPGAILIAAKLLLWEPAWAPWRRAAAFDEACRHIRTRYAQLPAPGRDTAPDVLLAEIARVREELGDYLAVVSWGIVFAYVFYHLLDGLAAHWAPALVEERARLAIGLPGVAALEAHHDVLALGTRLAHDPAWRAAARDEGVAALTRRVVADDGAVGHALRATLARHGHRLTGRDLLHPTWREAPECVVALALRSAQDARAARPLPGDRGAAPPLDAGDEVRSERPSPQKTTAPTAGHAAAARREQAVAAIERAIGGGIAGPARLGVFRIVLAAAQRYYVVRENMRYHADFFLARLRALALALGAQLVAEGRLHTALDVCFLDFDELGEAVLPDLRGAAVAALLRINRRVEGAASGGETALAGTTDLAALAAERRAALKRATAAPPPPTLDAAAPSPTPDLATSATTSRPGAPPPAIADQPARLSGEAGAPGATRARAWLVHGPTDFDAVQPGDVVVAAYADPAWTPLLDLASGLVLEAGGHLSHGAIVARELGIPALVGVAGATRAIKSGDTVELDAAAGVVTIVARA